MNNSDGSKQLPEKVQAQLDKILAAFASGDVEGALVKAITPRHPDDVRPCDAWSFRNRVIVALNGATDARGFRQWQDAGRHVVKGSRAFHILAPCTRTIEDEVTGEKRVIVTGFRGVPVFDVAMTDGDPLPTFDYSPPSPPRLSEVAERLGVRVTWSAGDVGAFGQCKVDGTEITMFTHCESTFWHELAHAADARLQGGRLNGGQDPAQEAVAELSAAVIARVYGAAQDKRSHDYMAHYGGGDALGLCMQVLARVEKVLALIFDHAGAGAELEQQAA